MNDQAAVLMEYSLASSRACADTASVYYTEKTPNQLLADKMRGKDDLPIKMSF